MAISTSSRFVLQGVLAESSGAGAALIATDGKPPKPFRVGSEVVSGYTLESVKSRVATLQSSTDISSKVMLEMALLTVRHNQGPAIALVMRSDGRSGKRKRSAHHRAKLDDGHQHSQHDQHHHHARQNNQQCLNYGDQTQRTRVAAQKPVSPNLRVKISP